MTNSFAEFDSRLKRIDRNRSKLASGYSARVTNNGLIVFRPKRRATTFSVRGLAYLIVGFFLFKSIILAHLGETTYAERVAALQEGTVVEQAGAYVMQSEPVTTTIAQYLRPYLN